MKMRFAERTSTAVALTVILWLYWWTVSAVGGLGPASRVPADNDYYNHLVSGFVHGHLYMDMPVSDGLKKLADPYDPTQNEPYRRTDASYFNGRYYLYFGAAPAVTLLLPYRLLTGEFLPTPWAILVFVSTGFLAAAAVFLALRRRYFAESPAWTAPIGVLIIGVGSTADVLLRRPFFWELATAGGFAFAMLAIGALYRAIHDERRPALWMAVAGACLGLAVGSRPTFLFAVPVLALPLLMRTRLQGIDRRWWTMAIGGALGIGMLGIAVFAYNFARFGNGFEFGHNYLLSIAYESKVRLFSPQNFWFNARMYFLRPGQWQWHPPFFGAVPVPRAEMPPGFYTVDDPFGLLYVFPVAVLAVLAPFALVNREGEAKVRLATMLGTVGVLFAAVAAVILLYVATIPRYATDFFPALMLLVAIGILAALRVGQTRRRRRTITGSVLVLAIVSLVTGTLTLFELGRLLNHTHPAALQQVIAVTRRLEMLSDRARGIHYGPVEFSVTFRPDPPAIEPLLASRALPKGDRVLVNHRSPRQIRFGLQHADAAIQWGRTIDLDPAAPHRITVELGSFYPEYEHGFFSGAGYAKASWLTHRAEVTFDGAVVLRTFAPFDPGSWGAPRTADPAFTGKVLSFSPSSPRLDARTIDGPDNVFLAFTAPVHAANRPLPLIVSGPAGSNDVLFLETSPAGDARLGYIHGAGVPVWSAAFPLRADTTHQLEFRQTETGWALPANGSRLLVAWLDGTLVWHERVPAFQSDPDAVWFGRNPGSGGVETEFPGGVTPRFAPPDPRRKGGTLLLRVMMPEGVKDTWQPLLCLGSSGAADTLSVDYLGLNVPQFRFDHWAAPLVYGNPEPVDQKIGHDIEILLPSFASGRFGAAAEGDVWVTVDGQDMLRTRGAAFGFSPDTFSPGENRARATMEDYYFRGAFVQLDWLGK